MSNDNTSKVGHRHTASEVRGGKWPLAMLPDEVTTQPVVDALEASLTADIEAAVANIDASQITSGTLATARVPDLDAAKITTGVLNPARVGGAWAAYTPTLTASTTNPNLGTAQSVVAAFTRVGKTVHWRAVLQSGGTGISAGSGTYNLTLPVAIRAGLPFPIVGSGWMYGNGGVFTPLVMDGNPGRLLMPSGAFLSHTQGFTAAGHVLSLSGTYEGD